LGQIILEPEPDAFRCLRPEPEPGTETPLGLAGWVRFLAGK